MKKIEFTLNNTKHTITMYTDGIETFVNLDERRFSSIGYSLEQIEEHHRDNYKDARVSFFYTDSATEKLGKDLQPFFQEFGCSTELRDIKDVESMSSDQVRELFEAGYVVLTHPGNGADISAFSEKLQDEDYDGVTFSRMCLDDNSERLWHGLLLFMDILEFSVIAG